MDITITTCEAQRLTVASASLAVPPELLAQLDLCPLQRLAPAGGKILAGAVDVEDQHRQRGAVWAGLAPAAALGGALERGGDAFGVAQFEHAAFEIEGVAFPCHPRRPAAARASPGGFAARRAVMRGLMPCGLSGCGSGHGRT